MLDDISRGNDRLTLTGELPATPEEVFRYWVEPGLLRAWWPQEAEVEPREDGAYVLSWPAMGWNLRGRYTAFVPGERLVFTWRWDHEPDLPERTVDVRFEPSGDVTRLTIVHGTYGESPVEQQDRQSHLNGWLHFVERLKQAVG